MPRLLTRAVKNRMLKVDPNLEFDIHQVNVNGRKMGCSGYVTDPETGNVIYLSTDFIEVIGQHMDVMFRTVRDKNDTHGLTNHWASDDTFAAEAVHLLRHPDKTLEQRKAEKEAREKKEKEMAAPTTQAIKDYNGEIVILKTSSLRAFTAGWKASERSSAHSIVVTVLNSNKCRMEADSDEGRQTMDVAAHSYLPKGSVVIVPTALKWEKKLGIEKVAVAHDHDSDDLLVWCLDSDGNLMEATYRLKAQTAEKAMGELSTPAKNPSKVRYDKDKQAWVDADDSAEVNDELGKVKSENDELKKELASLKGKQMGVESGKVRKLNAEVKRLNEELRKVSDKQNADHAETVLELERSIKELKNQLTIEKANHKTTKQEVKELNETIGRYKGKYADALVERKAALDKVAKLESELDAKASEKEEKGMAEVVQFNAPVNKTDLAIGVNDDGSGVQLDNESGNLTGRILIGWSVQGEKYWPITFNGKHIEKAKCLFIYGAQSNEKDEVQKSLRGIEGFEDAEIEWAPNKKCFFFDNPFCTAEQVA